MNSARRRSFYGLLGTMSLLAAVVLFISGCGASSVIDSSKLEDTLRHNLEDERGEKVSSIECPSDQEVEPKATFGCTVRLADGKTKTATIEIRNEDADVSVVGLEEQTGGTDE